MKSMRPYKGKLVTEEEYWTLVREDEDFIGREQYNKLYHSNVKKKYKGE